MERIGKYACIERERRFWLKELPPQIVACPVRRITDKYLENSRLRLRKVEDNQGNIIALKLTQKYPLESASPYHRLITNLYLNPSEFEQLNLLVGDTLIKQRYRYEWKGFQFGVDVFADKLSGLVLAEVEAATDEELFRLPVPDFACEEVTESAFFTGGNLAKLTAAELQQAFWVGEF
jgi:CYTH domain-containing protein